MSAAIRLPDGEDTRDGLNSRHSPKYRANLLMATGKSTTCYGVTGVVRAKLSTNYINERIARLANVVLLDGIVICFEIL